MKIAFGAGIFLAVWLAGVPGIARHYLEARGASTKYRFFDWNYTFSSSAIVDIFYVGVPGGNEFNFGGGYGFKPVPALVIAAMAYAVAAKEAGQRGIKIALLIEDLRNQTLTAPRANCLDNCRASARRPRLMRLFTVPSGIPSIDAISW